MFCSTYQLVGLCPQVVGAISGSWIVTVAVCKQDGGTQLLFGRVLDEGGPDGKVPEQICGKIKCPGL